MNANQFEVGQVLHAVSASLESRRTEPPEHYSEDTLLADMLAAHKFANNDEDREILRAVSGIGTARTRSTILSNFVKRKFLTHVKKGKRHQIRISEEGRQLLQGLPSLLTDVALTAKWERALEMVAKGQVKPDQFRSKVEQILKDQIAALLKDVAAKPGALKLN
jgi:DNA topoisomerase-3